MRFLLALAALAAAGMAQAADLSICRGVDPLASEPIQEASRTEGCKVRINPQGYPLPDPSCTPGAVNPTVTIGILQDPAFRTSCLRDNATSAKQKASTYAAYGIPHPKNNTGKTQVCELDHVISLELGGADTINNIFPQCGPQGVQLKQRYFKKKDAVENWLAKQVKAGKITLEKAQRGIAEDWTRYLHDALSGK
jgi:hypothetical protein